MNRFVYVSLIALCSLSISSLALSQEVLTEIGDIHPEQIKVEGFRLSTSQKIKVSGIGFDARRSFTRAWILDSRTRDVVWEMEDAEQDRTRRRLFEFNDEIELRAGDYEVYYSSYPSYEWHYRDGDNFIDRILGKILDHEDYDDIYDDYRDDWREFKIVVRGRGERFGEGEVEDLRKTFFDDSFIAMTELRDDEYLRQGFRLKRPEDIEVYVVGEANRDGTYDYGWIINTKNREKVWKLTYRDSRHAGGARKNRMVREKFKLDAGEYVAIFVTDDSHSYRDWNSSPPYDPMAWGMTLKTADSRMRDRVELFDYDERSQKNVIVDLTRLRNSEFRSEGFTLKRDMELRVFAIGEGKRSEMYDYGWIVDARTHEKVWEMEYYNTEHAGGGDKNRLFDEVIRFDKGSYIVYFVTDDSHSYWDWNTSPPYDQDSWGITVSAASDDFRSSDVTEFEERESGNVLAKIVRVRDHDRERESFTLSDDSKVRIYALGEGSDGRMYDFGWIEEEDTGRIAWEMTYRRTDHAGGARKNRKFDDIVFLRKGDYVVYYETDGSHSFEDWNSSPPHDPVNYGITVYLVED